MMVVEKDDDDGEMVAVAVVAVDIAVVVVVAAAVAVDIAAAVVVFEIDTLYVVVQTGIAQVVQVQVIEAVNVDLYAYYD